MSTKGQKKETEESEIDPEKALDLLNKYYDKTWGKSHKYPLFGQIEKITCVQPKNDENVFTVVVNDHYNEKDIIRADRAKPSWDLLYRVAKNKRMPYTPTVKKSIDYFNSNIKNKIYTKTDHTKTKILKTEGGFIVPNVKIELITERALKFREKAAQQ